MATLEPFVAHIVLSESALQPMGELSNSYDIVSSFVFSTKKCSDLTVGSETIVLRQLRK